MQMAVASVKSAWRPDDGATRGRLHRKSFARQAGFALAASFVEPCKQCDVVFRRSLLKSGSAFAVSLIDRGHYLTDLAACCWPSTRANADPLDRGAIPILMSKNSQYRTSASEIMAFRSATVATFRRWPYGVDFQTHVADGDRVRMSVDTRTPNKCSHGWI